MIYLKNNVMVTSLAMKKVGEIEYREISPKNGSWMLSKVISGLTLKQAALAGVPFMEDYNVDARVKVSVDGLHAFTLVNPHDKVWALDSPTLFHAYDDQKPIGIFLTNYAKLKIEWLPRKDVGREVGCGIRMGVYEVDEAIKEGS